MPYNFAADSLRNFVADFLQAKCDIFTEIGRFAFLRPPLGGLRGNVRCPSLAHWKAQSGLPISVN